jgi:uncharacterized protein (DUF4415 family)
VVSQSESRENVKEESDMENKSGTKRKTTTSTAVKQRYIKKMYSPITVRLPKELVSEFRQSVKSNGFTIAEVVRNAVTQFIAEHSQDDKK